MKTRFSINFTCLTAIFPLLPPKKKAMKPSKTPKNNNKKGNQKSKQISSM